MKKTFVTPAITTIGSVADVTRLDKIGPATDAASQIVANLTGSIVPDRP